MSTTTGFFLNHVPEGSMVIYEFHPNRPIEDFDYHQIYSYGAPVNSSLLTPSQQEFVSKMQEIRTKCTTQQNRIYLEWDNPLGAELKTPAVFIDFGPWWSQPSLGAPTESEWNNFLLETAQAAGLDLTLSDIPATPDTNPFHRVTFGFFPDRDQSAPWFRVVCARSVAECPSFAERLGFSTKWFDKFDLNKYCETCLVSFNIDANGVSKPAAEMILKESHQKAIPPEFPQFFDTFQQSQELILRHHGKYIDGLRFCHLKVTLTADSYEKQEAKMYMFAHVMPNHG